MEAGTALRSCPYLRRPQSAAAAIITGTAVPGRGKCHLARRRRGLYASLAVLFAAQTRGLQNGGDAATICGAHPTEWKTLARHGRNQKRTVVPDFMSSK